MPSPFPGMDPYLEKHWGDVHTSLVTYARDQLQQVLPNDLRARVEERVVISGLERPRAVFPDVRVFETARRSRRRSNGAGAVAMAKPLLIQLADEPETQRFIEIRDVLSGGKLITVIEVLSPSNKTPGDAQEQYLRKQLELIQGGVSLVEIDLLRQGDWIVAVPEDAIKPRYRTPYKAVVRRGRRGMQADFYPILLRDRLPVIRVPLRPTDKDVPLNLQALLVQCYDNGGYDDIDYAAEPEPPLPPTARRWAIQLLRRGPRRPARRRKTE